jgi:hypothetical protein
MIYHKSCSKMWDIRVTTNNSSERTEVTHSEKKSFHQTAAQPCVNENARCQNLLLQLQRHYQTANVIGNQP